MQLSGPYAGSPGKVISLPRMATSRLNRHMVQISHVRAVDKGANNYNCLSLFFFNCDNQAVSRCSFEPPVI